jgi:hypothetical protein
MSKLNEPLSSLLSEFPAASPRKVKEKVSSSIRLRAAAMKPEVPGSSWESRR